MLLCSSGSFSKSTETKTNRATSSVQLFMLSFYSSNVRGNFGSCKKYIECNIVRVFFFLPNFSVGAARGKRASLSCRPLDRSGIRSIQVGLEPAAYAAVPWCCPIHCLPYTRYPWGSYWFEHHRLHPVSLIYGVWSSVLLSIYFRHPLGVDW